MSQLSGQSRNRMRVLWIQSRQSVEQSLHHAHVGLGHDHRRVERLWFDVVNNGDVRRRLVPRTAGKQMAKQQRSAAEKEKTRPTNNLPGRVLKRTCVT